MPSLIDIRRRIRSVKSTQQITKAMKMVAAARLRRAQDRILAARPYARKMLQVLNSLAVRVKPSAHPLLAERGDRRILLLVVTADRGLCGSFNANIIKQAAAFLKQHADRDLELALVGRKGRDFFRRRDYQVRYEAINIFNELRYEHAAAVARSAIDAYIDEQLDAVFLLYNEFKSVLQQRVVIERLLPIPRLEIDDVNPPIDYLYEPAPRRVFDDLLPRHVGTQIYRALLESAAAEHAARMTAMDSATNNAADMIDQLTLFMNKVRQASITREIIEVVSGAESL